MLPHRPLLLALLASAGLLQGGSLPETSYKIQTLPGSFASLVRQGDHLYFFTEQTEPDRGKKTKRICPGINAYEVSGKDLTDVRFLATVAPNSLITDVFTAQNELAPDRLLTRLGVQYSRKDQKFFAIAYVSNGYPPADHLVVPALFQSESADPLGKWSYRGRINPDGKPVKGWGSGGNLILNENPAPEVDHRSPLRNKFVTYQDKGPSLYLIYSNDGASWYYYKDAQGQPANLRPPEFQSDANWYFPSVVRTKSDGLFMFVSLGWESSEDELTPIVIQETNALQLAMETRPFKIKGSVRPSSAGHRLLHSNDGLTWAAVGDGTLQANVAGLRAAKNISLGYDEVTDTLVLMITRSRVDHFKNIAMAKPKDLLATP